MGSDAELAAQTATAWHRRFACPSCRHERSAAKHVTTRGCSGYGSLPCADRRITRPSRVPRFEVHFEKLRNRVDGDAAAPFEAKLESISVAETDGVRWSDCDLRPPLLKQAAALFQDGLTVREVAATMRISKTEAGRSGHWTKGCWLMASPMDARSMVSHRPRGHDQMASIRCHRPSRAEVLVTIQPTCDPIWRPLSRLMGIGTGTAEGCAWGNYGGRGCVLP